VTEKTFQGGGRERKSQEAIAYSQHCPVSKYPYWRSSFQGGRKIRKIVDSFEVRALQTKREREKEKLSENHTSWLPNFCHHKQKKNSSPGDRLVRAERVGEKEKGENGRNAPFLLQDLERGSHQ